MKRRVVVSGMVAGALALAVFAGSVSATSAASTFTFFDCTGPGVPSTFEAVKTLTPDNSAHGISAASSFRVVGSTDVYTVKDFGFGTNHGLSTNGVATDLCWVHYAGQPDPVQAAGIYHGG